MPREDWLEALERIGSVIVSVLFASIALIVVLAITWIVAIFLMEWVTP